MKKGFTSLLAIGLALAIFSCNNSADTSKDTAKDTTKVTDTVAAAPVAAAFVPFKVMVVNHTVADFTKWKAGYDANDSLRKAYGLTAIAIGRGSSNPNFLWVVNKIDDVQKAKDFAKLPALKAVMKKAGVTSAPVFNYYNVIRADEAKIDTKDRVMISHKVKDFDAWLKVYDGEGKATRASQGVVDRVLARDLADSNMVHIVFAITDMTKAKAAIASEEKKKLMMSAGVVGTPKIEYFTEAN